MVEKIIVVNQKKFEETKQKIKKQGIEKFHVISDFDRTITYGIGFDGKKTATVISQIRSDPKYLGEEYKKEAEKLFEEFHPIEVDPDFPINEKIKKMHEWWEKHFELLINSDLSKKIITQVVCERPLRFRRGASEFLKFLDLKKIPVLFMSAGPGDMIEGYLEKEKLNYKNVFVVGNQYEFDKNGKAIKIKEPIIHTFNKTEVTLDGLPVFEKIKNRKNVLLLGDSIGDVGMIEGFDFENLIKIGFFNDESEGSLDEYKKIFDVVLTGDQDFYFVNKLVEEILK